MCADDPVSLCADDSFAMCADDPLSMCADDPFVETPVGFCLAPSNEWLMNFKQRPPWPWANHPWPESPKVMAQFLAIDCRSQPNHSDFTVP